MHNFNEWGSMSSINALESERNDDFNWSALQRNGAIIRPDGSVELPGGGRSPRGNFQDLNIRFTNEWNVRGRTTRSIDGEDREIINFGGEDFRIEERLTTRILGNDSLIDGVTRLRTRRTGGEVFATNFYVFDDLPNKVFDRQTYNRISREVTKRFNNMTSSGEHNAGDFSVATPEGRDRRRQWHREEANRVIEDFIDPRRDIPTREAELNQMISDFRQAYNMQDAPTQEVLEFMYAIANANNVQGNQVFFPNSPSINLDNSTKVHHRAVVTHINANNSTKFDRFGNRVDFNRRFHNDELVQAFQAGGGRNIEAVGFFSGDSSDPRTRFKYNVFSNDTERRPLGSIVVPTGDVFGDSLDSIDEYFRILRDIDFLEGPIQMTWNRSLHYFHEDGRPLMMPNGRPYTIGEMIIKPNRQGQLEATFIGPDGNPARGLLLNIITKNTRARLEGILGRSNFNETTANLRGQAWLDN